MGVNRPPRELISGNLELRRPKMILEAPLVQSITEIHKDLDAKGKILSKAKLAECRDTFRNRFGPEKLRNLDGEALLLTMHDHGNRDSLVYWLEFKSDDEFPAYFGGIAGGGRLEVWRLQAQRHGGLDDGDIHKPA